jgi:hypothetical protein
MNKIYPDETLKVGKILAIQEGHKLSIVDIKKITRAKKVKKLKWHDDIDVDSFIIRTIHSGIDALDESNQWNADVYYVTGEDAVSSMLRLKTSSQCFTVDWDDASVKKLHNACYTKLCIEMAKRSIEESIQYHEILLESFKTQKIKSNIDVNTKLFEKISEGYGDSELNVTLDKINELMKNVW